MSKYFKEDGKVYRALDYQEISQEELQSHVDKLTEELSDAATVLNGGPVTVTVTADQPAPSDKPADNPPAPAPADPPAPEAPAEKPAEQQAPAAPATPPEGETPPPVNLQ